MIELFISTATTHVVVSLVKDNQIIYSYNDFNDKDLSSRIMPIIDDAFTKTNLKPIDVNTIYIVTGPGSFTGIRMGVTIAKVMAWSLKTKIIPISSLELLSATKFDTDYVVPLIDARRDYVYTAIYDKDLNIEMADQHIPLKELLDIVKDKNVTFISEDKFDFETEKSLYDVLKVINKHRDSIGVNPHLVNPNYLKLTEAEENLNKENG